MNERSTTTARPPWWAPIPAVSTTVPCSGTEHELRWERGQLVLAGHDDVEAERALGALGAHVPACLRVRVAWEAHRSDPALVTLGRRPGEEVIGIGSTARPGARTAGAATIEPTRRDRLLLLFSLPPPLIDRLVLTAATSAADRWSDPSFRDVHGLRLGAALASRATPALRRLGDALAGPEEAVVVHATPAMGDGLAAIRAERTERGLEVTASLPLAWISTVWGAGISESGGRMVLAVRAASAEGPARLDVDIADWRPDGTDQWAATRQPAVLQRDGDGSWELAH